MSRENNHRISRKNAVALLFWGLRCWHQEPLLSAKEIYLEFDYTAVTIWDMPAQKAELTQRFWLNAVIEHLTSLREVANRRRVFPSVHFWTPSSPASFAAKGNKLSTYRALIFRSIFCFQRVMQCTDAYYIRVIFQSNKI